VRDALDGVAQTYFFLYEETRKSKAMRLASRFVALIFVVLVHDHDPLLPL
jgi:hypothetical protein